MSNEARVEQARELLQGLLSEIDLPGLRVEALGFDYVRQSFTVTFSREGQSATLVLPAERMEELEKSGRFAARRLRKEIESALDDA